MRFKNEPEKLGDILIDVMLDILDRIAKPEEEKKDKTKEKFE